MLFSHLTSAALLGASCYFASARPGTEGEYFDGLESALNEAGLSLFWNALTVANQTDSGRDFIEALYSDDAYTFYPPVNSAWESSGLSNPEASEDLVSLLSYHLVEAHLNSSTDIAPPRKHTVAFTRLHSSTILLPGEQAQVIVLETAADRSVPQPWDNTSILIRGDTWNATSQGNQFSYENLYVQPIDRILAVPSPLVKTLNTPNLALAAPDGALEFASLISSLGWNKTVEECHGCTFFVPVDDAFRSARVNSNYSNWSDAEKQGILRNHILNGTVAYSPLLNSGNVYVTAAGLPLTYLTAKDDTSFVSVGDYRAQFIRSDMALPNGVMHFINIVMQEPNTDQGKAESAVSSASSTAEHATSTGAMGISGATSTSTASSTATSPASTQSGGSDSDSQDSAAFRSVSLPGKWDGVEGMMKMGVLVAFLGGLWL
ncbi:hypothetical protein B9479_004401 [Cryptococcus floricola]|uniref:FAS1 domain-containing protein n=1 Tax=Cryptococcus floricola TaxID=2591691 RepID=A0A5D3AXT8_9TREE|nr:hypothetical protein B9479_004401 [Cryptococcus floricola]